MKFAFAMPVLAGALLAAGSVLAADPIKIGVSGPFTGGSSAQGVGMRDGVRLAIEEINKAGGVLGRPLQAVERDDEAKNEVGAQVAQELINKEKVVATVGFINTGVALASQRFYQEAEIPALNTVATATVITQQFLPPEYKNNYVFRFSPNDTIQANMIVDEAIGRLKLKNVAIFADSTNYGQLGRQDLEAALGRQNVKPVAVEKFNIKDVDMTAQLLRAKTTGADAILAYGSGPELSQIANGMAKLGWKVPIIGGWTLANANFIDTAGPNGEGARMPQTFIQEPNTPKRKAFIEAYQKAYAVDRMPSAPAASHGYDSIHVLAAAIEQAKSTEGPKVRAALESLDKRIEGVMTIYDHPFTAQDHEAVTANMPVWGIVKGGRIVYAYPEDNAPDKALRTKQK